MIRYSTCWSCCLSLKELHPQIPYELFLFRGFLAEARWFSTILRWPTWAPGCAPLSARCRRFRCLGRPVVVGGVFFLVVIGGEFDQTWGENMRKLEIKQMWLGNSCIQQPETTIVTIGYYRTIGFISHPIRSWFHDEGWRKNPYHGNANHQKLTR